VQPVRRYARLRRRRELLILHPLGRVKGDAPDGSLKSDHAPLATVLTPRERRYLSVYLPLGIVTAVLVDGAAFAAIGWPMPIVQPGGPCEGCTIPPTGTSLALGAPTEQSAGPNIWYNFTVQSAGGGITLGNLAFQVVTATGAIVPPGASWSLVVLGLSGTWVGTYSLGAGTWVSGGGEEITSGQTVVLDTGSTSLSGQGDVLNVIGAGSFQGSISVSIP
jgi:hypothetical protein